MPKTYAQILQTAKKFKSAEPKMIPFLARGELSCDTIHPGYLSAFSAYGAHDFDEHLKPVMNSPGVEFTDMFMRILKET